MDIREWNDGYKNNEKAIIKFVKKKLDSMSSEEFLSFLKKRESYRKFVDHEANETMNKITVTEPKGVLHGLTSLGFVFYLVAPCNLFLFVIFRVRNESSLSYTHDRLCRTVHIIVMIAIWKRRTLLNHFLSKVFVFRCPNLARLKKRSN